jgi:hypothetical protein
MKPHRAALAALPVLAALAAGCASPPASPARAPARVRSVLLRVNRAPQAPWPDSWRRIEVRAVSAPDQEPALSPGILEAVHAKIVQALVAAMPDRGFVDPSAIATMLREEPGAEIPRPDAFIETRLRALKVVPGPREGEAVLEMSAVIRLVDVETADICSVVDHQVRRPVPLKEGDPGGRPADPGAALAEAVGLFARDLVAALAGERREEAVFLFEAGPLTAEAIREAAAGRFEEARKKFEDAAGAEAERSAAWYALSVLLRFEGDEDNARRCLARALE